MIIPLIRVSLEKLVWKVTRVHVVLMVPMVTQDEEVNYRYPGTFRQRWYSWCPRSGGP